MSLLHNFDPKYKASAFHILGVAHAIADGNYPTCPFTSKSAFFSKALMDAGYKVFYYGQASIAKMVNFLTLGNTN